jgi:RNA polymerase sigma factor (sigma-70 family)
MASGWRWGEGLSDESLLTAFGLGHERAAAAFVGRFQHRVYGLALAILGDGSLAQDIAQEAFVRAWRRAEAFDARRGSVLTWLLAITRNVAIDALRLHRPWPADPDKVVALLGAASEKGPAELAVRAEEQRGLVAALGQVSAGQRRAVVLSVFGGRTAAEIASIEGIPLGTVKTRIRDGLTNLRRLLASEAMRP